MMRMTVREMIDVKNDYLEKLGGHIRGATEWRDDFRDMNRALAFIVDMCHFYRSDIGFVPEASEPLYRMDDPDVFSRRMIQLSEVWVGGKKLDGPMSAAQLQRMHQGWRWEPDGTTTAAVYEGNNQLRLYPPPDAATVALGRNYVAGYYTPGLILADGSYFAEGFDVLPTTISDGAETYIQPVVGAVNYGTGYNFTLNRFDFYGLDLGSKVNSQDTNYVRSQLKNLAAFSSDGTNRHSFKFDLSVSGLTAAEQVVVTGATHARLKTLRATNLYDPSQDLTVEIRLKRSGLNVVLDNNISVPYGASYTDYAGPGDWVSLPVQPGSSPYVTLTITGATGADGYATDIRVDHIEVEFTNSEGTPSGETAGAADDWPLDAYLDIRESAHYGFALLSAVLASNHSSDREEVMARVRAIDPQAWKVLQEMADENAHAIADSHVPTDFRKTFRRRGF